MRNVYEFCSRFESCSANKCPLDPLKKERDYLKGEPKCEGNKRTINAAKKHYTAKICQKS